MIALGEVGIGNTTCAAALYTALALNESEEIDVICGAGSGLDAAGIKKKVDIISRALQYHSLGRAPAAEDATSVVHHAELALRFVGGAEIVAMCGATMEAHEKGIGILVDGYIATSAALAAASLEPRVIESFFFSPLCLESLAMH